MTNQTPTVANGTDTTDENLEDQAPDVDIEPLLTIAEVAEKLRIKPWFASKIIGSGALPCVYLGPKSCRVRPDALRAYMASLPSERPAPKNATA